MQLDYQSMQICKTLAVLTSKLLLHANHFNMVRIGATRTVVCYQEVALLTVEFLISDGFVLFSKRL